MNRATSLALVPLVLAGMLAGCNRSGSVYPEPPAGSFLTETVQLYADGTSESVTAARVTPEFFTTHPMLGRVFVAADFQAGATSVVVLHAGLWERRHKRDVSIIGRIIQVNGRDATVVGIMPRGFDQPAGAELWLPKSGPGLEEAGLKEE